MKIVTISREFGSGGRELGKRLADALGFAYYDKEILDAVEKRLSEDESYVKRFLESGIYPQVPLTYSRTLSMNASPYAQSAYLLSCQHNIIRELAEKGDCIIVGRGADAVLKEFTPFSVFVYADMASKLQRCRERADDGERLTDRELERSIRAVDKSRAGDYQLIAPGKWGDMHNYSLCVNTTGAEIKQLVPQVAELAKLHFARNGS